MSTPAQELRLPVSGRFVLLSLLGALFLNMVPWQGASSLARPDFVALTLLYWTIYQPRKHGIGTGWVLGLLTDVTAGTLLGQHALAYAALTYAAVQLRRRVLQFPAWGQALHVLPLLVALQVLKESLRLTIAGGGLDWSFVWPAFSGALLWPVVVRLLPLGRRRDAQDQTA